MAPIWLVAIAAGTHAIVLAQKGFFDSEAAWLLVAEAFASYASGAFFLLTLVVFIFEANLKWAAISGAIHALVIFGANAANDSEWLNPSWTSAALFGIGIPVLAYGYVEVLRTYAPGGHSIDEWLAWSEGIATHVNSALQAGRQALDTANAAADAARTVAGQAADIERMQAERAEMQALIAELGSRLAVLEAREAARAKDAERKRNERAKKSENP